MLGIIPAAGVGSRIQPLGFSKELLPVGSFLDGECERPRAVSEYLVERMVLAGATRICFVISMHKADIVAYYGASAGGVPACYVVQTEPAGLCDAVFQALPLVGSDEQAVVGLPDTVWFPERGIALLGADPLSFLLFHVDRPELFDAVVTDEEGRVSEIQAKQVGATSPWIWGAFKTTGSVLSQLYALYRERGRSDVYLGPLVNAWIARGGLARGIRAGEEYVDVGTIHGYREALALLARHA